MPNLKPGWRRVKFAQLAECVNDRVDDPSKAGVDRYVGLEHLDPESLTIRRWGTPDEVESTKLRFRPGDIIFGKRRAYQRKLAVADFDGICSAHAMVLRAKSDVVLPEFLPFLMQSDTFMERAVAISVGSLSPTINWKTLAAEEFALPPMEEQRRAIGTLKIQSDLRDSIQSLKACAEAALLSLRVQLFPHSLATGPLLGRHVRLAIEKVRLSANATPRLAGVLSEGRGLCDQGFISRETTQYQCLHRLIRNQLVMRKLTAWEGPITVVTAEFDGYTVSPLTDPLKFFRRDIGYSRARSFEVLAC